MKDGVTVDAARADATIVARRLKQQYGDGTAMTDVAVIPLRDEVVGALLAVVALLACETPAIRAARIDPVRTLRAE